MLHTITNFSNAFFLNITLLLFNSNISVFKACLKGKSLQFIKISLIFLQAIRGNTQTCAQSVFEDQDCDLILIFNIKSF